MENVNIKKLNKMAKSNSDAKLLVARMNIEGEGVEKNVKTGIKALEKAAKKGNFNAYNFLAFAYATGNGVKKNIKKASTYYSKGTKFGDGLAEYSLYVLAKAGELGKKKQNNADEYFQAAEDKQSCYVTYYDAVSLKAEYLEAISNPDITKQELDIAEYKHQASIVSLKKAHEQGCVDATLALGIIYLTGDGVEQDINYAIELLESLDEEKCPFVYYVYGYMYELGLGVKQDYWVAFEYYKKAYRHYLNHQNQEEEVIEIALALCKLTGLGCDMDQEGAFQVFTNLEKSSGNAIASYYLGLCCTNGEGTKVDYSAALKHFENAANKGYKQAYYQLGKLCDVNYHKDNNKPDKCFKYYEQAADAGIIDGKVGLGKCYMYGIGANKDMAKAYELISEAARAGSSLALYEYANLYINGNYLAQDIEEGIKYMNEAAKRGSKDAVKFLGDVYTKGGIIPKDPAKAFKIKELMALDGDKTLFFKLAQAYYKGINNVVEKNGEMAAYWCAKTTIESPVKKEREKAANMLTDFSKDLEGNWDFKKIVKKRNKKLKKAGVKPVEEKSIDWRPRKAAMETPTEAPTETPVETPVELPVEETLATEPNAEANDAQKEVPTQEEQVFTGEPIKLDDMLAGEKVEEAPADDAVENKVEVENVIPTEDPAATPVEEVEEAPVEEAKPLSKKEAKKLAKEEKKKAKKNK